MMCSNSFFRNKESTTNIAAMSVSTKMLAIDMNVHPSLESMWRTRNTVRAAISAINSKRRSDVLTLSRRVNLWAVWSQVLCSRNMDCANTNTVVII